MPLGVLNNISAVYAENNLNQTQSSLQNVLTQLSSGSRINSGADDPAGLSIANGLAANSAALSQSSSNASEGAGFLQVADGALSQVTSLLTSAITLATEAGGGTLSSSQLGAANQEYQDILTQIGTIGSTTEYNGITVFSSDQTTSALGWGAGTAGTASSATGTSAAIASSAIVTGGTTAGTAPALTQATSYGTPAAISWSGDGTTSLKATIAEGTQLSGTISFVPTVGSSAGTAVTADLSSYAGLTSSVTATRNSAATALAAALNAEAVTTGNKDYTVTDDGTSIVIGLGADVGSGTGKDNITALAAPTTGNTGSMAQPSGFSMTVTDGDSLSGSLSVSAAGDSNSPYSIDLTGVTTANLVNTVELGLGGKANGDGTVAANPDYSVSYSSGTLSVSLTSQAGTDSITSLSASGTSLAETAPKSASITVTDGDTLGGTFTITPTVSGTAGSAVSVDLTGVTTANLQDTVNAAMKSAGLTAADYTVAYTPPSGSGTTGTLSIGVSAQGTKDGVNSLVIANGTGNTALSEGTSAVTNINSANTVMGNFTVTPSTSGGAGTAVNVDLDGVTNANLLSTVQKVLGNNYNVAYDTTKGDAGVGNLTISVSSTGAAAGVTGFTVAEASQAAASQETPIAGGVNIYTSDGTTTGSQNYNVTVGTLSNASVGTSASSSGMGTNVTASVGGVTGKGGVLAGAGAGTSLTGTDLLSQADAEASLETINNAIGAVAYQRGQVGANINTLTAASNIASSQMTNITSAENTITATDYASATSNMSKYEILTQTGISALAQANSTQQMVTKLLQ